MELLQAFLREYNETQYPPELLAHYELLECLSANDQGETLLARDIATGEKAVVKCYPRQSEIGYQEAELLRTLEHPGVPRLLGEYLTDDMRCVARTYAAGQPLSAPGLRESLTRDRVIAVGMELCDILSALHGRKPPVIHRDVKPQNVIMADDGHVSLIDFGISRAYDPMAESDTVMLGTKKFAAPEQYSFGQTDTRSDLYSLGAVMMYLLTGTVQPDRIARLVPDRGFAAFISRCMAFDPRDRWQSADETRRALSALRPDTRRKRRIRAVVMCALGLALIAAAGIMTLRQLQSAPIPYVFAEPMIEQEVRLMLGLSDADVITKELLATVTELYIYADTCCESLERYNEEMHRWYQSNQQRGPIVSLADLEAMPKLRQLCMGAQRIVDVAPLAALADLERVELRINNIVDVSALAEHAVLGSLGLNGNPVRDLKPLESCQALKILDLCDASGYDPSFLQAFSAFDFLDVSNHTESYKYLSGKAILNLRLCYSPPDSLDWLSQVSGLQALEIDHSFVRSLDGIERHQGLSSLRLSGLSITDFSPLAKLPRLTEVRVDQNMLEAITPIAEQCGFTVNVE